MRRRAFIGILALGVAGGSAAAAEERSLPLVAVLSPGSPEQDRKRLEFLRAGLKDAGFSEPTNMRLQYWSAGGKPDRLHGLAEEIVRQKPAVIVSLAGTATALALKRATSDVPIVFSVGGDPVKAGLVGTLSRPSGNVTGIHQMSGFLDSKRLELLRELVPSAETVAVLQSPENPNALEEFKVLSAAAAETRQKLVRVLAGIGQAVPGAFDEMKSSGAQAVLVSTDPLFLNEAILVAGEARRTKIPAVYGYRECVEAGGLASYGASNLGAKREAGVYAGLILSGRAVADLPVTQPTTFELVISARTAKELSLSIPPTLLTRADEVIE